MKDAITHTTALAFEEHKFEEHKKELQVDEINWRLHKGKHETPCCQQAVRVKIVEPGPQYRKCPLCKDVNVFVLEPMDMFPDKLRLRWLDDVEIRELHDVEGGLSIDEL